MSIVVTIPEIPNEQNQPDMNNVNNEILHGIKNNSKVFPSEEPAHLEISNRKNSEKVEATEIGEDVTVSNKQQKSFCKRNFNEILILGVALSIIAICFFGITVNYLFSSPPELIYVNVIWRHTDRAPAHYLAGFTDDYMIAFPNGLGNITKKGIKEAEQLGLLLKRYYIQPKNITSDQIYINSTKVHRTIATARHILKAMSFPDVKINSELSIEQDSAGNPFFNCPATREFIQKLNEEYYLRENFTELYELMERKINSSEPYYLFDTINSMREHDLLIPDWLQDEELYEKLKFLSWRGLEAQFGFGDYKNEFLRMIRGGSALRAVVSRIACKVNYTDWQATDSCSEKFYGLSGHDVTIAALFSTFNDIDSILGKSPLIGFGAQIMFEIWLVDKSYQIKVFYANAFDEERKDITKYAPGCENAIKFCDVNKFIEQSRLRFFDNIHERCFNGTTDSVERAKRSMEHTINDELFDFIKFY